MTRHMNPHRLARKRRSAETDRVHTPNTKLKETNKKLNRITSTRTATTKRTHTHHHKRKAQQHKQTSWPLTLPLGAALVLMAAFFVVSQTGVNLSGLFIAEDTYSQNFSYSISADAVLPVEFTSPPSAFMLNGRVLGSGEASIWLDINESSYLVWQSRPSAESEGNALTGLAVADDETGEQTDGQAENSAENQNIPDENTSENPIILNENEQEQVIENENETSSGNATVPANQTDEATETTEETTEQQPNASTEVGTEEPLTETPTPITNATNSSTEEPETPQENNTETPTNTPPSSEEKSITIDLNYATNSQWDIHNNGVEAYGEVIDLSVENSAFTWEFDPNKTCTRWTIENANEEFEQICSGASECCSFLGKTAEPGLAWDRLQLYEGLYGTSSGTNTVRAEVVYYDVNLDLEHLRTDIVYSEAASLPVRWVSLDEVRVLSEICIESCSIPVLPGAYGKSEGSLRIEVSGDAVVELDSFSYTAEHVNRAPQYFGEENISISAGAVWEDDISSWFLDPEGSDVFITFDHGPNLNVTLDEEQVLRIAPEQGFTGERDIYLTGSDGEKEKTATLTVFVGLDRRNVSLANMSALLRFKDKTGQVYAGEVRSQGLGLAKAVNVTRELPAQASQIAAQAQVLRSQGLFGAQSIGPQESTQNSTQENGGENITSEPEASLVASVTNSIEVLGANLTEPITGYFDTLEQGRGHAITEKLGTTVVALPSFAFERAEIALAKTGDLGVTALVECPDFNFTDNSCPLWVKSETPFVDNGTHILFNVTHFSGYGGANITIIDIQSYPSVGGNWTVRFSTVGVANLTITGINGTTFTEWPSDNLSTIDDLTFLQLYCGEEVLNWTPVLNGSKMIGAKYENYSCNVNGSETSHVLTPGKHHLEFRFGDDVGYANNDAAVSACGTISTPGKHNVTADISGTGTCITITSDDVDLNCEGHTITYGSGGTGIGINVDSGSQMNNVTVRNCVVRKSTSHLSTGSNYGIFFDDVDNGSIENITIYTNGTNGNYGIFINNNQYTNISSATIFTDGTSSQNFGVYLAGGLDNTLQNSNITTDGDIGNNWGVYTVSNSGNQIINNSIQTGGGGSNYGVRFGLTSSNVLYNNTIQTTGTVGYGVYLNSDSDTNNFTSNRVTTTGSTSYGVFFENSGSNRPENNIFTNDVISATSANDVRVSTGLASVVNYFVNVTFDENDVSFGSPSGKLDVAHLVRAQVNDSGGSPITNTLVSVYTNASVLEWSALTDGTGLTNYFATTEYVRNNSGRFYNNNFTFDVSALGYLGSPTFNITESTQVNVTLSADPNALTSCGTIASPGNYYIYSNLSTTATCITITSSDVHFTCLGNTIYYGSSSTGKGIDVDGTNALTNVTIRDCVLIKNGTASGTNRAIEFDTVHNSSIVNNTLRTNGTNNNQGIFMTTSFNNTIENNTIFTDGSSSGNNGIYLFNTNFSAIRNNFIRTNGSITYVIYINAAHNNTVEENNLTNHGSGALQNDGIRFNSATHNIFRRNIVIANGTAGVGVRLASGSNSNIIQANTIVSEGRAVVGAYGVLFTSSNGNYFSNNSVTTLLGTSQDYGIYILNSNYTEIHNNNISSSGTTTSNYGLYLNGAYFNELFNNRVSTNGTSSNIGVYLTSSSNNSLQSNTIVANGSSSNNHGTLFEHSSFNNFTENAVFASGSSDSEGLRFYGTTKENFINGTTVTVTSSSSYAISFGTPGTAVPTENIIRNSILNSTHVFGRDLEYDVNNASVTNYFVNVTFNQSSVVFTGSPEGKIDVAWFARGYVEGPLGPLSGINVTAFGSDNVSEWSALTSSDGFTSYFATTEYLHNDSGRFYLTNYTFNASKSNGETSTLSFNVTTSGFNPDLLTASFSLQNSLPSISSVVLNATNTVNSTLDNLSLSFNGLDDPDSNPVETLTNWLVNNLSLATLYLPFDTNTESIVADSIKDYSSFFNNATLSEPDYLNQNHSIPSWNASCAQGGCYYFDGASAFATAPLNDVSDAFTLSVWIKPNLSLDERNISGDMCFLDAGSVRICLTRAGQLEANIVGHDTSGGWTDENLNSGAYMLTTWNGSLYGGGATGRVYRFTGSGWTDVSGFLSGGPQAATVWNQSLYVGTSSGLLYRYTGGSFTSLGDLGGNIEALAVWNDTLFVGFTTQNYTLKYDGSIFSTSGPYEGGGIADVYAMAVWNNTLYAASNNSRVYLYNGSGWEEQSATGTGDFRSLASHDGDLYAGKPTTIFRLNGSNWVSAGSVAPDGLQMRALVSYNGSLYAGVGENIAKGTVYRRPPGGSWSQVGSNFGSTGVYALSVWNGTIYAGEFGGEVYSFGDGGGLRSSVALSDAFSYVALAVNSTHAVLYLNGQVVAQGGIGTVPALRTPLQIGRSWGGDVEGTNSLNFDGFIDEVHIYNRTLSAEQIASQYNGGVPRYTTLVAAETSPGETWYANVTPNDGSGDGLMVRSNDLTIFSSSYSAPTDGFTSALITTGSVEGVLVDAQRYAFAQNVTFSSGGRNYARVFVLFNETDVDLSTLTIESATDVVSINLSGTVGVAQGHRLYLPQGRPTLLYVCPSANQTSDVSLSCVDQVNFSYAEVQGGPVTRNGLTAQIISGEWVIDNLSGSGMGEATCSGTNPPSVGNWNVLDSTACYDGLITLNGNLTVFSDANLTFENVTLVFNTTDGITKVLNNTGTFHTNYSNITVSNISLNSGEYFRFFSAESSRLRLRNTFVTHAGDGSGSTDPYLGRGISVLTDNALIDNVTIVTGNISNGWGIYTYQTNNLTVVNSSITTYATNSYPIYLRTSTNASIVNNTLDTDSYGANYLIYTNAGSGHNILRNKITGTSEIGVLYGIYSSSSRNTLISNDIDINPSFDGNGIRLFFAHNTTIVDNDINVTGDFWGSIGINFESTAQNTTTRNNRILTIGSTSNYGMVVSTSHNTFINNTITTNGSSNNNHALRVLSSNNSFVNNSFTSDGSGTGNIGIYLDDAENTTFYRDSITSIGVGSYGIMFEDSSGDSLNNYFTEINITAPSADDIRYSVATASAVNYLINATLNYTNITFEVDPSGKLDVAWWVRAYVNDTFGVAVPNAEVTAFTNDSLVEWSDLTDSSGLTAYFATTEYVENNSGRFYFTNYTFNVTHPSLGTSSRNQNITQQTTVNISFIGPALISSCQTLSASATYFLDQNVSTTGTCFTITSDEVTLDCKGNSIVYGSTGTGNGVNIDNGGQMNNVSVQNCVLIKNGTAGSDNFAIRLDDVENSTFFNNTIKTNGTFRNYAFYLLAGSNYNNITNNTAHPSGSSGNNYDIYLDASSFNLISGNTFTTDGSGSNYGLRIGNSANNNSIINNNISTSGTSTSNFGLWLESGSYNLLQDNNIATNGIGSSYGIQISDGSLNSFINNTITPSGSGSNNYGFYLISGSHIIIGNVISTSGTSTNTGIYALSNSDNNTIDNNSITTSGPSGSNIGARFTGSSYNTFTNNRISTTGSSSNYGIYVETSADNNTFTNNTITTYGTGSSNYGFISSSSSRNNFESNSLSTNGTSINYGIILSSSSLTNLSNNTIITNGSSSSNFGVYLTASSFNIIDKTNVFTDGTSSNYGIHFESSSSNNTVLSSSITTSTVNSYGLYFLNSGSNRPGNNSIKNTTIIASAADDIVVSTGLGSIVNYLINTTFDSTNVSFGSSPSGALDVAWYVRAQVNSSEGVPLQNVLVTAQTNESLPEWTSSTDGLGLTNYFATTEYTQNDSGRFYNNNYTFSISLNNYYPSTTSFNVSTQSLDPESITVNLTANQCLGTSPPSVGNWSVQDSTVCLDTVVVLNGNLTVFSGANLTFENVTLVFNTTDGITKVLNNSGNFYVNYSTLNVSNGTVNSGEEFRFFTHPGGYLSLKNSLVTHAGDGTGSANTYYGRGINIQGNNSIIENTTIIGSNISSNGWGIYLYSVFNVSIFNTTVKTYGGSNAHALHITSSHNNTIAQNSLTTNGSSSSNYGTYFAGSDFNSYTFNVVTTTGTSSSYGLYLDLGSNYNTLLWNNITTSGSGTGYGAFFDTSNLNTFAGNRIQTGGSGGPGNRGISLTSTSNTTIENNTISTYGGGSDHGIYISSGQFNQLRRNVISTDGVGVTNIGIYLSASTNNTLEENNISTDSSNGLNYGTILEAGSDFNEYVNTLIITNGTSTNKGVIITSSNGNLFTNSTIITSGSSNNNYGFQLTDSSSNIFNRVAVITDGTTDNYGYLFSSNSDNNRVQGGSILTIDTDSYGVFLQNIASDRPDQNIFNNTIINTTNADDFRIDTGSNTVTIYLINVSYNQSNITFVGSPSGNLDVAWWVRAQVNDTLGTPLENANVSAFTNDSVLEWSDLTDSSGLTAYFASTEYVVNNSGRFYLTNYTFNATKVAVGKASQSFNVTTSSLAPVSFTLNLTLVNVLPVIDSALVNASSVNNRTTDNLTLVLTSQPDDDEDDVVNITNWYLDGSSFTVVNLPFEGGSTSGIPVTNGSTRDYSGYNYTTHVVNATWNSTAGFGNSGAYTFNGADEHIVVEYQPTNLETFSVAMWLKLNTTAVTFPFGFGPGSDAIYGYLRTSDNLIGFGIEGTNLQPAGASFNPNEWIHIVFTYESGVANGKKVYFQGQELGSATQTESISASSFLVLGRREPGNGFNGTLDEFMIFNRSLSPEQVLALYNNRTDLIVSQETTKGDNWSACVTPNDGKEDGITVCSNNLIVLNSPANVSDVVLTSSRGINSTLDNLSVTFSVSDGDSDVVYNITDWRVDGNSMAVINMPFEAGSSSGTAGQNGSTRDYSTYGNNGTVVNATLNASGGYDGFGAYAFDGEGDYIAVSGNYSTGTEARTLCAWVQPQTGQFAGNADHVVNYGNAADGQAFGFMLYTGNTWWFYGHGANDFDTGISADTNWHHHCIAYDGSVVRYYYDGVNVSQASRTLSTAISNFTIGTRPDKAATNEFNGSIDHVLFYNRTLSSEQILALYQNNTDLIVSNETQNGDTWQACITPNDGEEDGPTGCSNELTVGNNVPYISSISDLGVVDVLENNFTMLNFSVVAVDIDNVYQIQNVNLTISASGSAVRSNASCSLLGILNTTAANYSCFVELWYFDQPGSWDANATVRDALSNSAQFNQTFVVSETLGILVGPVNITFGQLFPGRFNQTTLQNITLNNTGNANFSSGDIFINATDARGQSDASLYIPAYNFSIGAVFGSECLVSGASVATANNTEVAITSANLSRGNYSLGTGAGQEVLYLCLREVPREVNGQTLSSQVYASPRAWEIRVQ